MATDIIGHGGMPYNQLGQMTTGEGGPMLQGWLSKYFSPANNTSLRGPSYGDSRTHMQLADQRSVIAQLPAIYLMWVTGRFSWVNQPDFVPAVYSDKLEYSQEYVEFDEGVYPEEEPEESVARTFGIKKSSFKFRARRVGIAYRWSVDNMFTPEGKNEFILFTAKIAESFVERLAITSLVRLLEPSTEDAFYRNVFGTSNTFQRYGQMAREVRNTYAAHKHSSGPFSRAYEAAREMVLYNPAGGEPNYLIYDPRYQSLWKFFMSRTSSYDKAGPAAVGMLTDTKEVLHMGNMKLRPVPSFPGEDAFDDELNLMSQRMQIGGNAVWRNVMIDFTPDQVNIALQGYIYLLDESKDLSPVKISLAQLNNACLDWAPAKNPDGSTPLHPAFDNVEDHHFANPNTTTGTWGVAEKIGQIKGLPRHFLKAVLQQYKLKHPGGAPPRYDPAAPPTTMGLSEEEERELLETAAGLGAQTGAGTVPMTADILKKLKRVITLIGTKWVGYDAAKKTEAENLLNAIALMPESAVTEHLAQKMVEVMQVGHLTPVQQDALLSFLLHFGEHGQAADDVDLAMQIYLEERSSKKKHKTIPNEDNLTENVENASKWFGAANAAYLWEYFTTPITKEAFDDLISRDIFPPVEYIVFAPFQDRVTSQVVLVQGGPGLAIATYGLPNIMIGENAKNKTGEYHVTMHHGAAVRDKKRRKFEHHFFYQASLGGGNVKFMTHADYTTFKEDKGYAYNGDLDFPSLLVFSIPIGSTVADRAVDMRGKCFPDESAVHYASYEYVKQVLDLDAFDGMDASTIYERAMRNIPNMVTYQMTQVQCGDMTGKPGMVVECRGHDGIVRPGDVNRIRSGQGVREDTVTPLF
jgi:hypothetical protein